LDGFQVLFHGWNYITLKTDEGLVDYLAKWLLSTRFVKALYLFMDCHILELDREICSNSVLIILCKVFIKNYGRRIDMSNEIQPSQYKLIAKRIVEGRCVPFLGAGVNVSSGNYKGLPLAYEVGLHMVKALINLNDDQLKTLTKNAAQDIKLRLAQAMGNLTDEEMRNLTEEAIRIHLKNSGPLPNLLTAALPDLSRIALQVEVDTDFGNLMGLVHEVIKDTEIQPSPLLETLALLPFKLIVSANYDRLLERAFADKQKTYELIIQPVTGFKEDEREKIQNQLALPSGPIIYKIHGSFYDDDSAIETKESNQLILTEEDYIQFLSIIGREDLGVPTLISANMINSTILFLGYSLQDWDFRTIYKTLIEPLPEKQRPKSYAIQKNPPDFWVRYWQSKGVTILDVDLYEFAAELQKYWQNEAMKIKETSS